MLDLRMGPDHSDLPWSAPADPGTREPIVYDALRSPLPNGFDAEACLEVAGSGTTASDQAIPLAREVFFHLVREVTGCGGGDLGTLGPDDWPREAMARL